jgi:hypothetical protein
MPSFRVIAPDQIARARQLYEGTSVPVRDIAALVGLGASTFARRVKLWGWTPRNRRLAEYDAAAKAGVDLAAIEAAAAPAKATLEHAHLIDRVRSAVEREIAAIDAVLARVEGARLHSSDAERAARTLATLVRTLRELAALETIAPDADKEESGDEFRDLEEFRRELTRRLEGLNKKRSGA